MPAIESKIRFDELPLAVKPFIQDILSHRSQMRSTAKVYSVLYPAILGAATAVALKSRGLNWDEIPLSNKIATYAIAGGVPLLGILRSHRTIYYKEEANLFLALRDAPNPRLQSLLSRFPYVVVNRNGDLIGKKRNPVIGFVSVGRRRIPTQKPLKKPVKRIRQAVSAGKKVVKNTRVQSATRWMTALVLATAAAGHVPTAMRDWKQTPSKSDIDYYEQRYKKAYSDWDVMWKKVFAIQQKVEQKIGRPPRFDDYFYSSESSPRPGKDSFEYYRLRDEWNKKFAAGLKAFSEYEQLHFRMQYVSQHDRDYYGNEFANRTAKRKEIIENWKETGKAGGKAALGILGLYGLSRGIRKTKQFVQRKRGQNRPATRPRNH